MSVTPQYSTQCLNSLILEEEAGRPPHFSSSERTSLKSPQISQGREWISANFIRYPVSSTSEHVTEASTAWTELIEDLEELVGVEQLDVHRSVDRSRTGLNDNWRDQQSLAIVPEVVWAVRADVRFSQILQWNDYWGLEVFGESEPSPQFHSEFLVPVPLHHFAAISLRRKTGLSRHLAQARKWNFLFVLLKRTKFGIVEVLSRAMSEREEVGGRSIGKRGFFPLHIDWAWFAPPQVRQILEIPSMVRGWRKLPMEMREGVSFERSCKTQIFACLATAKLWVLPSIPINLPIALPIRTRMFGSKSSIGSPSSLIQTGEYEKFSTEEALKPSFQRLSAKR
ncbi:uncharacterized protein G2W53_027287 [Senna tora]|uniref:Uncharacterized protein n=1 Tax=Senna tora TaxID=362788 RepID=A0A834TGL8_9FABA|nr:uncharacterized protein G2W53_027287 [Senna tora]